MWGRVASDRSHLQTRGDGPQNSRPSHTPGSDPRNAQATSTNHSVTSSWAPTVRQAPARPEPDAGTRKALQRSPSSSKDNNPK